MGGCRCSFRNCPVSTKRNPGMHFFHYPYKHEQQFKKWIEMTNNADLPKMPETFRKNQVVCARHFRDEYFMNYKRERLLGNHTAVPTLFRLNDELALDFEYISSYKRPLLIRLQKTSKPHLLPPPDFILPFTWHDNIGAPKEVSKEYIDTIMSSTTCPPPSKRYKAIASKAENNHNVSTCTDKAQIYSISIDIEAPETKTGEDDKQDEVSLIYLPLEEEENESPTLLNIIEKTTKWDEECEDKCDTQKDSQDDSNGCTDITEDLLARIKQLDNKLKTSDTSLKNKTQELKTLNAKFTKFMMKYENIAKENSQYHSQQLKQLDETTAMHEELQRLRESNKILELKCMELEKQQVNKITTTSTTPSAGAKQPLTKAQIFNHVKKYVSASMAALLRLDMFGSVERESKPDEKRVAMDLLQLGENVYEYINDEWRIRLPPMRQVRVWLNENEEGVDEEDI